jgi:hypothetical protein
MRKAQNSNNPVGFPVCKPHTPKLEAFDAPNWLEIFVEVSEAITVVGGRYKLITPAPNDLTDFDRRRYDENDNVVHTLDTEPDYDPEALPHRDVANAIQRELDRRVRAGECCISTGHRIVVKIVKGVAPNTLGLLIDTKRVKR